VKTSTAELPVTPIPTLTSGSVGDSWSFCLLHQTRVWQKINGQSHKRDADRQLLSCLATCFKHDASAAQMEDNKDVNILIWKYDNDKHDWDDKTRWPQNAFDISDGRFSHIKSIRSVLSDLL